MPPENLAVAPPLNRDVLRSRHNLERPGVRMTQKLVNRVHGPNGTAGVPPAMSAEREQNPLHKLRLPLDTLTLPHEARRQ